MDKNRIVEAYRGYDLVAANGPHLYQGIAWKNGKKALECAEATINEVLERLRRFVDESFPVAARLRTEAPKDDEYERAFQAISKRLSTGQYAMLKAHHSAPNQTITATQLAVAAGYKSHSAANLQYGNVGKALYEELPTELRIRADGTIIYTSALATAGDATESPEEHWTWKMRPEVAFAIKRLGLAK